MFENYFNLQKPIHNNEDLHNLLFKQLIIEAFTDNETQFDNILQSLVNKNVSMFEVFTMYPEYIGSLDNNNVQIERNDSDYRSFISASHFFIKNEKYLLKLVNKLTREEVLSNEQDMTIFILGLLDNQHTKTFNKILENNLLTEKEIKLKLILPEQLTYYFNRQINFHTLETEFLSKHIHELKINNNNIYRLNEIYRYTLAHANTEQYKKLTETIQKKVDFSKFSESTRKEIFKTLLEFGVLQPNQLIGSKYLIEEPTIEVKSFLDLSASALEKIINLQNINLEKRLSSNSLPTQKERIKKI